MAGGRPRGSPLRRVTRSALRAGGQGRPPLRICGNACVGRGYKRYGKTGRRGRRPLRMGYKGYGRRADVGIGPYGSACRGGRPCPPSPGNATLCRAGPACPAAAPGKKNPPVTALPCQPPLGKGAKGTGVADCHTSVRTGFAMTHYMKCGTSPGGRPQGSPLRNGIGSACGWV